MFLAHGQESCKVTIVCIETVDILACNHEEVDTGISLHVKHASEYGNQRINLISNDTNVMVVGVSNSDQIGLPIFQKRGNQPHMRYINTSSISNSPMESISTALSRFYYLWYSQCFHW